MWDIGDKFHYIWWQVSNAKNQSHSFFPRQKKKKWHMKLRVDFMKQKHPFFQGACMKPIACGQKCWIPSQA